VTGGITPKNIEHIEGQDSEFMKAYRDKGRVSPLLETIPLFAVMVEDLGVRGAFKCCFMEYERLYKTDSSTSDSKSKTAPSSSVLLAMIAAALTTGVAMSMMK